MKSFPCGFSSLVLACCPLTVLQSDCEKCCHMSNFCRNIVVNVGKFAKFAKLETCKNLAPYSMAEDKCARLHSRNCTYWVHQLNTGISFFMFFPPFFCSLSNSTKYSVPHSVACPKSIFSLHAGQCLWHVTVYSTKICESLHYGFQMFRCTSACVFTLHDAFCCFLRYRYHFFPLSF